MSNEEIVACLRLAAAQEFDVRRPRFLKPRLLAQAVDALVDAGHPRRAAIRVDLSMWARLERDPALADLLGQAAAGLADPPSLAATG